MKYFTLLILMAILPLGACAKQEKTVKKTIKKPAARKHRSPLVGARVSVMYSCDGQNRVHALYVNNPDGKGFRVRVDYERREFFLPSVMSASGARYSDGTITWWTKGSGAFMMKDDVITLRNCREEALY